MRVGREYSTTYNPQGLRCSTVRSSFFYFFFLSFPREQDAHYGKRDGKRCRADETVIVFNHSRDGRAISATEERGPMRLTRN